MSVLVTTLLFFIAQSSAVQGVVLKNNGSQALSKAVVELRSGVNETVLLDTITTEDDGRFLFVNVRPGRYRLNVTRTGYVQRTITINVSAGQPALDFQVSIRSTGSISGRVFDAAGRPAGNIEVQALRASYPQGRRVLEPVQSVITNDLGEYRLFWLPPGRYYVAALHPRAQSMLRRMFSPLGVSGSFSMGGNRNLVIGNANSDPALSLFQPESEQESYVPNFFGGVIDEDAASVVDLRPSAEFSGANIIIAPVRARHIRGVVIDGLSGKPAQYASFEVVRNVDAPRFNLKDPEVDRETGYFDIVFLPGTHTLNVSSANGYGNVTVKLGDSDINNLTIATYPGFDLPGRLTVEGPPLNNAALDALKLSLRRDPPRPEPANAGYSNPLPNGSFTLDAGIGDFRVNIAPLLNLTPPRSTVVAPALQNVYVKSIRFGEADVLNGGLHIDRKPTTPLEIVLGANPGAIDGLIVAEQEKLFADSSIVLLPDQRRRTELYRVTTSDASGRFHFDRVPPGDYKVFAWEEVVDGAWFDPEFMRAYENRGVPVRVVEGRTESVRTTLN